MHFVMLPALGHCYDDFLVKGLTKSDTSGFVDLAASLLRGRLPAS